MNRNGSPTGPLLAQALRAPLSGSQNRWRVGLGGLLSLVPVVNFVAWGYLFRVFENGLAGAPTPDVPPWGPWRAYFATGSRLFLISAGYLLVFTFAVVAVAAAAGGASIDAATTEDLFVAVLGAMGLFNLFSPVAYARFATEGRAWAAFEPDALWADIRRVIRPDYVQLVFLYYGLWLTSLFTVGMVPYAGLPVASVFQFYLTLALAFVFGRLVGERLGTGVGEGGQGPSEPA